MATAKQKAKAAKAAARAAKQQAKQSQQAQDESVTRCSKCKGTKWETSLRKVLVTVGWKESQIHTIAPVQMCTKCGNTNVTLACDVGDMAGLIPDPDMEPPQANKQQAASPEQVDAAIAKLQAMKAKQPTEPTESTEPTEPTVPRKKKTGKKKASKQ